MCDTMVALGSATKDGSVIFAKNSDRQPNEPHLLIRIPRKRHPKGAQVKCTYITIDQVEETYDVLLLKPSWMWGAEMGANEWGLNIGNEAVFTKDVYKRQAFMNSLVITVCSVIGIAVFSAMTAYLFVRTDWRFNKLMFRCV